MPISEMLPHKTKPKCKRLGLSVEESLDILDIDKKLNITYADEKRGAIDTLRNAIGGEIELGELLEDFETNQCYVRVYKTKCHFQSEDLYVLTSVHKNNDKILIRFGNACQIACIKNSYRIEKYIFKREQGI